MLSCLSFKSTLCVKKKRKKKEKEKKVGFVTGTDKEQRQIKDCVRQQGINKHTLYVCNFEL